MPSTLSICGWPRTAGMQPLFLRQILNELQILPAHAHIVSNAECQGCTGDCSVLRPWCITMQGPTTHQATFTMNRSSQRSCTLSQVPLGPAPARPYRIICEGNQRGVSAAETCVGQLLVTVVHDLHASNSASTSILMKSVVL